MEAKRAAGHSNITTTQIYVKGEDYGMIGAVSSAGKIDKEIYKKVDYDVLLEAIGLCKDDVKLLINLKINEVIKQR
jgi:hypothetical protein